MAHAELGAAWLHPSSPRAALTSEQAEKRQAGQTLPVMKSPKCGVVGAACAIHTPSAPLPSKPPLLGGCGGTSHCCLSLPPLHAPRQQRLTRAGTEHSPFPSPSPQTPSPAQPKPLWLSGATRMKAKGFPCRSQRSISLYPLGWRGPVTPSHPGSPSPCLDALRPLRPPSLSLGPPRREPGCGCPQGSLQAAPCAGPGAMKGWKPQQNAEPPALGLPAMHP